MTIPLNPRCLFVTALNSIRDSISSKLSSFGLGVSVVTPENVEQVVLDKSVKVLLVGPEVLAKKSVIQSLLSIKEEVCIKVVDEAHLFVQWSSDKKKGGKVFRPAMDLSSGELSCFGGITVLQTATATRKTIRILQSKFPEVKVWNKIVRVPLRDNVTIVVPPSSIISSKFQRSLEPFIRRIIDYGECHLILVRSINFGTEVFFHLLSMIDKKNVAFYHRYAYKLTIILHLQKFHNLL